MLLLLLNCCCCCQDATVVYGALKNPCGNPNDSALGKSPFMLTPYRRRFFTKTFFNSFALVVSNTLELLARVFANPFAFWTSLERTFLST